MSDSRTFHSNGKLDTSVSIIEIPPKTQLDSSPVTVEVVKQGGMLAALAFLCLFVYLLTELIKASKAG